MKVRCCECKQPRHCRPTVLHKDGQLDQICRICWAKRYYDIFLHVEGCGCPHCSGQQEEAWIAARIARIAAMNSPQELP